MKHFDKYQTRGADYHYRELRPSLKAYSLPVAARFERLIESVVQVAGHEKLKLLDVGCGDGVALYLLSQALPNLELYGIDLVPEALETAKSKVPHAKFVQGLTDSLPYLDELFDLIISSDVIEHVENPEKMLSEIKRVAKSGATIIIGTPIKHSKVPLDHNHVEEFFTEDFLALMQKHFRECELHETHDLGYFLLYNRPPHSLFNFKYLINLLSLISGWNPFRAERTYRVQMFAYMYVRCKK